MTTESKAKKLLRRVFGEIETVSEFIEDYFNLLVDDLNNLFSTLSLSRNFSTQYFQSLEIAAGATLRIEHKLRSTPSYKLVVKQSGGGLITDGEYTENYIELTNTGGSTATISVIIFRE